jgi:hypothetical protein
MGTEEVIQITLNPGGYELKINYFGAVFGEYNSDGCDLLRVEAAIVPRNRVVDRVSQISCPAGGIIYSIVFSYSFL